MSNLKGYPSQSKLGSDTMEHACVVPSGTDSHGLMAIAKSTYQDTATDLAEALSTDQVIVATAHGALVGDVLSWRSGVLSGQEYFVTAIPDANSIRIGGKMPSAPGVGDEFRVLRSKTQEVSSGGGIVTGPITFTRDGSDQVVTEDTGTPANNRPLPVKITGLDGDVVIDAANLNLEVQLDHDSANPDSIRVGDGTETLAIEADSAARVAVTDAAGNRLGPNADGSVPIGDSSGVLDSGAGNVSAQTLRTTPAADSPHLLATRHEAAGTPLSGRLSDGVAFYKTVEDSQIPATLGAKTSASSLSVTISTDEPDIPISAPSGRTSVLPTRVDFSSTNIDNATYTEIVASTSADINKLHIADTTGEVIILAVGAAASEVDTLYVSRGGDTFEIFIPSGSRLSLKAVTLASITTDDWVINGLS